LQPRSQLSEAMSQRQHAGEGTVRFVCDAMLGGLARWLRAAGYSAEFDVHARNGALVKKALDEAKILLTSDSGIMDRYAVSRDLVRTVFVPVGLSPIQQLAHVLGKLALGLLPSRCMDCNGPLKEVPLAEVQQEVPDKVKAECEQFFVCAGCGKVFWHGTHWESIERRLCEALALASGLR